MMQVESVKNVDKVPAMSHQVRIRVKVKVKVSPTSNCRKSNATRTSHLTSLAWPSLREGDGKGQQLSISIVCL